jgi:hypothetical protein
VGSSLACDNSSMPCFQAELRVLGVPFVNAASRVLSQGLETEPITDTAAATTPEQGLTLRFTSHPNWRFERSHKPDGSAGLCRLHHGLFHAHGKKAILPGGWGAFGLLVRVKECSD